MKAFLPLVALALGLSFLSFLDRPLKAKPVSELAEEDEGLPRLVYGIVAEVGEKSFAVCWAKRCIRALHAIPQTFRGRRIMVEGVLRNGVLSVREKIDVLR